jgi:hypothetical protein
MDNMVKSTSDNVGEQIRVHRKKKTAAKRSARVGVQLFVGIVRAGA